MSRDRIQDDDFEDWLQLDDPHDNDNWITQQAALGVPITLPWKKEAIRLGTCFLSSKLQQQAEDNNNNTNNSSSSSSDTDSNNPWLKETPFILSDLYMIPKTLRSEYGSTSSYHSVNTNQQSETGSHLSLGFGMGVGLPLLASASVKGTYDEEVKNNNDSDKSSIRASVRSATVELERNPRLSHEACALLKYGGGYAAFTERYGDYFVWGYRLGGDTGLLISSSSYTHKRVEKYGVKVTLEVVGIEESKTWTKDLQSFSTGKAMRLVGYDTLSDANWNVTTTDNGLPALVDAAASVIINSQSILERTLQVLEKHNMADGDEITLEECEFLTASGMVVELVLLPMSALRDVARWTTERNVI